MVRQEGLKRFNGGIVADEMGLGKTVQSIALMCHNRPTVEDIKEKRTCTLLLGPVALLEQWRDEIEEKTQDGLFRCLLYHGSKKPRSLKELQQYDIILTTYQTLAFECASCPSFIEKDTTHVNMLKLDGSPTMRPQNLLLYDFFICSVLFRFAHF